MDITILQFYPLIDGRNDQKQILQGTIHILLNDYNIELKGIFVSKKKDAWFISLPTRLDDETGTRYPVFSFSDRAKTDDFIRILKEKGRQFVESYLLANPQPITQEKPPAQEKAQEKAISSKTKNDATEAKKSPSFAMLKPTQYVDVPIRKSTSRKGGSYAKR